MYDVTSEQSFLNVRNWMSSVKEGVEEHCVLCVVANKIDLCENEENRAVSFKDGATLAEVEVYWRESTIPIHLQHNECLYFETSAANGYGITECMKALAVHLQEREDQAVEDALKLENVEVPRRRRCCKA